MLLAFEMVTGKRPYRADDAKTLMQMHVERDIPDPATITSNIPEAVQRFIQISCRRSPADRYQSVADAAADLKHQAKQIGLDTRDQPTEKLNRASLLMAYSDRQDSQFREFMDQIQAKARELGIVLKSTELNNW